ncbi:hypothetical protein BD626DRAFT_514877 [Schizophyllum amplum]|uniref:Uncharacterized protein n=1 Tax=Schizophyllum amplum TaxID=97359 RepID=A0A550BY50_9AGAR|nr:hypothetical protein BD626DRAFT_514877 [Auriculariopsis ampla]
MHAVAAKMPTLACFPPPSTSRLPVDHFTKPRNAASSPSPQLHSVALRIISLITHNRNQMLSTTTRPEQRHAQNNDTPRTSTREEQ